MSDYSGKTINMCYYLNRLGDNMAMLLKTQFDTTKEEIAKGIKECEEENIDLTEIFLVEKCGRLMSAGKRELPQLISAKEFKDNNPELF